MDRKTYVSVTVGIFIIVAIVHLTRAVLGWQISIAEWVMPTWISWIGFIIASFIAYTGYTISKQS